MNEAEIAAAREESAARRAELQARIDAMTPAEKVALRDGVYGLSEGEWKLLVCTDCHPDYNADRDEDVQTWDTPMRMAVRSDADISWCPRCSSYLSMLEEIKPVTVTSAPREPSA